MQTEHDIMTVSGSQKHKRWSPGAQRNTAMRKRMMTSMKPHQARNVCF